MEGNGPDGHGFARQGHLLPGVSAIPAAIEAVLRAGVDDGGVIGRNGDDADFRVGRKPVNLKLPRVAVKRAAVEAVAFVASFRAESNVDESVCHSGAS